MTTVAVFQCLRDLAPAEDRCQLKTPRITLLATKNSIKLH